MNKNNSLMPVTRDLGTFIDDFFNRSIGDFMGRDFTHAVPAVNVSETDAEYKIDVAAPGLDKADFNISLEDNHLVISAKKEQNTESEGENFKRREFNYTSFQRSFQLPEDVNVEGISAGYDNGILAVVLPKNEVTIKDKVKTIDIS